MPSTETRKSPSQDEVLEYARKQADYYIQQRARALPKEQQEEVFQNAMLRALEAYSHLDPTKGWKSYIQRHSLGAIQDYMRDGHGFQESKWSLAEKNDDEEEDESEESADAEESFSLDDIANEDTPKISTSRAPKKRNVPLRMRVEIEDEETGEALDVEAIAGIFGAHSDTPSGTKASISPNWPLVSRMSSVDPLAHVVAKALMGFSHSEMAPTFGVSRERLTQRIKEFSELLDNQKLVGNPWAEQLIFAFDLGAFYGFDPKDNGVGWSLPPVDLFQEDSWMQAAFPSELEACRSGTDSRRRMIRHLEGHPNHYGCATADVLTYLKFLTALKTKNHQKEEKKMMDQTECKSTTTVPVLENSKPKKRKAKPASKRGSSHSERIRKAWAKRKANAAAKKKAKNHDGKTPREVTLPLSQCQVLEIEVQGPGKFKLSGDPQRIAAAVMAIAHPEQFKSRSN